MKISAAEWAALGLTAVFLAFSAGWLARGGGNAAPVRIETEQTLTAEEQAADLPPVTATEEPGRLEAGGEDQYQHRRGGRASAPAPASARSARPISWPTGRKTGPSAFPRT